MRIVHRASGPRFLTLFVVAGIFAAAALYFQTVLVSRETATVFAILAALALIAYALVTRTIPVLVIDDAGIFDARLGIRKIPWRDIEDVTIEATYGNRFLCVRVRDPQAYISQLQRPDVKHRMMFHQNLGFKRFNVDVGGLDVSLLDLKNAIDARVPQKRTRRI
jgi:succinate dehydrogenase/fumarate reductase cytochrome b subunit